jgi:hypothetical protein
MNAWGIAAEAEARIRKRDRRCVYCRTKMRVRAKARGVPPDKATWEHIDNNDLRPTNLMNIAICCGRCNSSKGAKKILKWFESDYCIKNNISAGTVAPVVKRWLSYATRLLCSLLCLRSIA